MRECAVPFGDEVLEQRLGRIAILRPAASRVASASAISSLSKMGWRGRGVGISGTWFGAVPVGYSPSLRSGVRSNGSSRSISFVKMRSERL
jgi:hypothetical protein